MSCLFGPDSPGCVVRFDRDMAAFASGGGVGRFVGAGFDLQSVCSYGVSGAAIRVAAYVAIAISIAGVVFHRRDID